MLTLPGVHLGSEALDPLLARLVYAYDAQFVAWQRYPYVEHSAHELAMI